MVKEQLNSNKGDFQKELKEKVREGIKPSDLKKLKRSKSEGELPSNAATFNKGADIPKAPPLPTSSPLSKSKSSETSSFTDPKYPYTTLISQQEELDKLKKETQAKSDTIALLRKKIDELEKSNPPNALLTNQLQTKQLEIESLRKQLEKKNEELKTLKQEHSTLLDDNLSLKHQGLKDWFQQYQQTQKLETELAENVDYASNELVKQDKVIEKLRGQVKNLELTNQSLQKDLNLATKLAELRSTSLPTPENSFGKGALIGIFLGLSLYLLNSSWKHNFKDN